MNSVRIFILDDAFQSSFDQWVETKEDELGARLRIEAYEILDGKEFSSGGVAMTSPSRLMIFYEFCELKGDDRRKWEERQEARETPVPEGS